MFRFQRQLFSTSALNENVKGILYVTGILFTMALGNLTSSAFPNRVPGFRKGTSDRIANTPTYDPACNIFDTADGGWGTLYSSPGPHALFYGFTFTYICAGMFLNNNIHWAIFGILIAATVMSAALRLSAPMLCVKPIDLILGYIGGILCGLAWFVLIYSVENSSSPPSDLTYFNNNKSDREFCKLEKTKLSVVRKNPLFKNPVKPSSVVAPTN